MLFLLSEIKKKNKNQKFVGKYFPKALMIDRKRNMGTKVGAEKRRRVREGWGRGVGDRGRRRSRSRRISRGKE